MINIHKNPHEPPLLKRHRTSGRGANYENGPADMKRQIAEQVVAEQHYLCCYCMQPVAVDSVRVEHKLSQSRHPELSLDYQNMAGACSCCVGEKEKKQYCEVFKGEQDFTHSLETIQEKIQYDPGGRIKSTDATLNSDLESVLNLNIVTLRIGRKQAYEGVIQFLTSKKPTRHMLMKKLKSFQAPKNGKLTPFCGVTIFFLKKRLQRL